MELLELAATLPGLWSSMAKNRSPIGSSFRHGLPTQLHTPGGGSMTSYEARTRLYDSAELLDGFNRNDPMGFTKTRDFFIFRQFVQDGLSTPTSNDVRQQQAAHDAGISGALASYLKKARPLVGIMGGHRLNRDDPAYKMVADLAQRLTQEGFLVATGGGPGAMEAAHLGATFVNADESDLKKALQVLCRHSELPRLTHSLFNDDGSIKPSLIEDLQKANSWFTAALDAREFCPSTQGESLAIPTWRYGQEPTTPLATAYAKYFQNSIREEALVAKSKTGIIYARGGGGTIREIFQDAEENYYAEKPSDFTPMIFFDPDKYWQHNTEFDPPGSAKRHGVKIDGVITEMFRLARAPRDDTEVCLEKVRFTIDFDEIITLLKSQIPWAQANLTLMLEGRSAELPAASWNR
ncbi:LOG family protein [Streptomyces sp. NPDC060020]|uniref:LOG family protein n=1 Tax=Streptomyces sp. NPDC060020 TaxID=3347038 RepID=UPI0036A52168